MDHHNHDKPHPSQKISPSSVYYCPMECEGEKLYFKPGRCPVCNMFLVPIEEREDHRNKPQTYSKTNLPDSFKDKIGDYFCPMFCEGDKTYKSDSGCPVCHMHLEEITQELVDSSQLKVDGHKKHHKTTNHQLSTNNQGKYYCPMFCEGDKVYDSNVGCPVCGMDLVMIPMKGEKQKDETYNLLKRKFLVALSFTIPVFILSMGKMWFDWPFSHHFQNILELILTLPVLFYAGWFLMRRGWISFKTWNLNMFSLIALGVFAAMLFSLVALVFPDILPHEIAHANQTALYFESVCVILTLVIMGQMMEARAHHQTGKAIKALMNLSPETANLIVDGFEKKVPLAEIKINDIIRVKPGEKIPVDGKITEGNSNVDE